ncbi:GNAT family N-acetyltransferase [Primorskyibacter sp. S187A]|uniref:GNAT family N-acetyltransferase n=1 Tax=Primorskyibacter sp. S187A TaxID=3415130 RepID=UPI003C7C8B5C
MDTVCMISKGQYTARLAEGPQDVARAQALRFAAFHGGVGRDCDGFDARCDHLLVEDAGTRELVCTCRMLTLHSGAEIDTSYSAQFYDLSALHGFEGPVVEMGRFCVHPASKDGDILRVAWAALTQYVDARGVTLLFGCTSFDGTEHAPYDDAFAVLKARHLAPARWLPRIKAPNVFRFAARLRRKPDAKRAMQVMPPLLRTYLMMGGWVSDHAVVDPQMNTLHVFTGVEIGAIPDARKRLLRAVAG